MKEFSYVITSPEGLHARPAGLLVKQAASFKSSIKIKKDDKEVDAKRILGVMSLGIKKGQELIIKVDGEDEEEAVEVLSALLKENL